MTADSAVLKASNLSVGYVGQPVVRDVSFTVRPGEVVCLLGPNGAGKTTTLLGITGVLPLMAGTVEMLDGLTDEPLYRKARAGLSFVTEERSIIRSLTTSENIRCAGLPIESVTALFPELESRLTTRAGLLSGGEQQMLTLGRALAREPRLLLADELSLGLAPLIVDRLLKAVRQAADERQTGVLMVEQHARKALAYADRAIVMQRGSVVLDLTGAQARERISEIEDAYLTAGTDSGAA
ncbi:MAG: ATP-binding cassette domain-containing protein [Candidatus Nanopelagicales bacterium]